MGAIAAWASLALAAGSTAYGVSQNKKEEEANAQMQGESKKDYAARLKMAGKIAGEMEKEYNKIVEQRPGLSWESFMRDKIKAISDPYLRQFYTNAKVQDWDMLRAFAKSATSDNVDSLMASADKLSGGRWKEITDQRDKLVLETDAGARMARAYELAAPVRTGASTVRYDDQGRLIEGQRADKQAFSLAQEVVTATEQEQKADLRQLETDRLGAAQSQVQKADQFMQFFDPTGYATAAESDRSSLVHGYQNADEERQFELYKLFAQSAGGITPTQPQYTSGAGNAAIAAGVKLGGDALSAYSSYKKGQNTNTGTTKAYTG
jgi:hypothetical protein